MGNSITFNEQKMASLAQMLGLIAALPVWLAWRNRSAFVRAHAVQSMLFDVLLVVAMIPLLAMLAGGFVGSVALHERPDASLAALAFLLFGLPLCSLAGMLLVLTLVLMLRLRAAMAALQGQEYRYPLVGRWG